MFLTRKILRFVIVFAFKFILVFDGTEKIQTWTIVKKRVFVLKKDPGKTGFR